LSALSPMSRAIVVLLALAAVAASGTRGAQVATVHRRSPAASSQTAHTTHNHPGSRAVARGSQHSAASRIVNSRSALSREHSPSLSGAAHRQSADEVGRRAGLAIRRQLARRRGSRPRAVLLPARYVIDRRAQRTQPADSPGARDTAESSELHRKAEPETAPASMSPPLAPGEAAESETPQITAGPRNAPVEAQAGEEVADNGSASVQRLGAPMSAPEAGAATPNAPADDGASGDSKLPPATEAASVRTETEGATLRLPHGGMPSPLRGSLESLTRQNARLDAEGLERIEDESDLAARIAAGLLVPVPASAVLTVNGDLPANHRYCRPWTAKFLTDLARAHEAAFHKPLEVSSAVRTVEYQRRLMTTNGNAAPAEGDVVSPHLTGAAVDIAKSGLTRQELAWMRQRLMALQSAGKIDVEEEFRQACFHISVYKNYAPERTQRPRRRAAPNTESDDAQAHGM